MRYRAIGRNGMVVSALSIGLSDVGGARSADQWTAMIYAALENGINCFELMNVSGAICEGLARALEAIDRQLIFVACRMGRAPAGQQPIKDFSSAVVASQLRAVLGRTGLGYLDLAMYDQPRAGEVLEEGVVTLKQAREAGALRMIGVSGADDDLVGHIESGWFDVLGTPYNLTSGWRERNWLRTAGKYDMSVLGYDPYPVDFHQAAAAAAKERRAQLKGRMESLDGAGSYDFLDKTKGWSAEEICLAYALTEPALSSVQLQGHSPDQLEKLATITEKELPPGVSAQIEMGRFAPEMTRRTA
jgi:aryl-alcohol dehydrogenase-like predicted oxidoreductase